MFAGAFVKKSSAGITYAMIPSGHRLDFGADAAGVNLYAYGATTGKYMKWKYASDYLDVHGYLKVHNHSTTIGYAIEAKSNFNGTTTSHFGVTSTVEWEPTGDTATAGVIEGLQGVGRLAAGKTITGGTLVGTYGQACNLGTINGSGVMVAGLYGLVEDGGTYTSCSHVAGLWVDSHLTKTISSGTFDMCYITNNGTTVANNVFYVYAADRITNLFTINTTDGSGTKMVSEATTADYTFTKTRKVKVNVGGETGYIVIDCI
ncbi:MAG: hypothetical protein PHC68_12505 [Syntrophorhabdaceae bacterium]|nr:hypothetical protein [Syntrophorhabdaceae bacterium]